MYARIMIIAIQKYLKNNNILKYNHGEKSMKLHFIIYTDLKCLPKKINTFHNNCKKSSTTKIYLQVIHCLLIVHFMSRKINMIIIEAKTV